MDIQVWLFIARKLIFKALVFTLFAIFLSNCAPSATETPTLSIDTQYTLAAKTVIAEITRLAPTKTDPPTESPTYVQIMATETQTSTITPAPTPTVTPFESEGIPDLPDYNIIFQDDFSSGTGWYESQEEDFGFRFTEQGYAIYINILNATIWSIRDIDLSDSRIEIIAEQVTGPMDGYYGASCRHQDGENYYGLVISNDGSYGILKMELGRLEFLAKGMASEGIIKLDGSNVITADCIGDTLSLYSNGRKLMEVQDDTFLTGIIGLIAGTQLQEGVEVEFKQIQVQAP